jgi:DNA topoisomerase-1
MKLVRRLGLTYVTSSELTIRRQRHGQGFRYIAADGRAIGATMSKRLASLAVPPAYTDVLYATDANAHIQAIARDAAGRQQYRYHPNWQRVRERRKALRLVRLADALPHIRRSVGHFLAGNEPTRSFTMAAIIELVGRSAIRPGGEQYVRLHGTRGAATLLKSDVTVYGETVRLHFQAKGGKPFEKDVHAPKVAHAIDVLRRLPGRRLFQYRTTEHELRTVSTQDVNRFLREIAGVQISLKDFRTLLASVSVIVSLMHARAATSKRARRRQVLDAICEAAAELGNTPAICGKSYVNKTIVNAFEDGLLEQFAETLRGCRSSTRAEKVLGQIAADTAAAGAT